MAIEKTVKTIGRVEKVSLPEIGFRDITAKIDTGAKTSSVWASKIRIEEDGKLSFCLMGQSSPFFTGTRIIARSYTQTVISSSMGHIQRRYKVKLLVRIRGRKIRASFTLANRSRQVYPLLIGRNVLRGKFIVDVTKGRPLIDAEKRRTKELRKYLKKN